MRTLRHILLCLAISTSAVTAADLEFTEVEEYTPRNDDLVSLNLDGRYSITLPGEFQYWTDTAVHQYFQSRLLVFKKFYPGDEEKAHMLHVQFLALSETGAGLFKNAQDGDVPLSNTSSPVNV